MPEVTGKDVTLIKVANTRYAMAFISAAYFGYPAEKLRIIGITGTKGKTTTTYMVKSILENAGYKVGLVGTIEVIIGREHIHAGNTTPESYALQEYFARMVEAGMDAVVMEVSSQGLMLHRTQGFVFDLGIFTNLEPDHIGPNEHSSFEEYLYCKGLLFKQCRVGIVNGDDSHVDAVLRGIPVRWSGTASGKTMICGRRMCGWSENRGNWAWPSGWKGSWTLTWKFPPRDVSASTMR